MSKFIRFLALVLLLVGVFSAYVGYAYRAPNATLASGLPKIGALESIARNVRALPYKTRESLNISREGLFPSFVGGGGGLILISLILFVLSAPRKPKRVQAKPRKKAVRRTLAAATSAQSAQNTGEGFLSDLDATLLEEEMEEDVFSDIGKVISLSHSTMEESEVLHVLRRLNPKLVNVADRLPLEVLEKFAKQELNIYIIRTKRSEKEIAPDQFRIQDTRMNELIRETIARRFLPRDSAHLSDEAKTLIGKVYTLSEQAKIQQVTQSQTEDWQDLSVRNAEDVMKIEPHA